MCYYLNVQFQDRRVKTAVASPLIYCADWLEAHHIYYCCYFLNLWHHFHVRTDSIDTTLGYKLKVSHSRRVTVDIRSTNSYTDSRRGHLTPNKTYETSRVKWILSHFEKCARMLMVISAVILQAGSLSTYRKFCHDLHFVLLYSAKYYRNRRCKCFETVLPYTIWGHKE